MLLTTVTCLPRGYRIVATSTCHARYYCWGLYRNNLLLAVISRTYHGKNSINFDLKTPLAPGHYTLRVECFTWASDETAANRGYWTDVVALPRIGDSAVAWRPVGLTG